MNPSRLFILRPVATTLLMVAILLAGLMAYRQMPLSALPEVDYPTIQVVTLYPGASPEVMTSTVTAPLETQFGQMPGLTQMLSTSSGGASVITLRFSLDLSLDIAEQQVQAAVNAASNLLPDDLPTPPIYSKVNPADAPIITLAVTSQNLPLTQVHDLVDTRMAQKLSQLPGVGLVTLAGGQRPAVRVQVNPVALASAGLTLENVRTAITGANVNSAKGSFDGPAQSSTIDANDQLKSPAEYGQIVLAYKNGAPIRLTDVADVIDGAENNQLGAWAGNAKNGSQAILINVQRQPGANVIQVVEGIHKLLPTITDNLPPGVNVTVLSDRTTTIRASVHDVEFELMLSIALVVMVIFLFLRNLPATFIPAAAVPLSLVGTFGVIYLAGFSINNLTLMALTIATGFVVDDAIVMIENISRYIEQGKKPLEAALTGARQIGFTIISLTISLIAVLIPLLFMGDVIGRLFREFAITLAVAILISAFVSLTLTPMMCARLLRHVPEEKQGKFYHSAGKFFDDVIAQYGKALRWVLNRQKATLLVALGTLVLTVLLYVVVPKGFFPVQDTGQIQAIVDGPQATSFGAMASRQQQVAQTILQNRSVESVSSYLGVDGTNATLNSGRLLINLKPHDERQEVRQIIRSLQQSLSNLAGVQVHLQPVQDITLEDRLSRTQYQLSVQDADPAELAEWVPKLVSKIQTLPGLADVASDLQTGGQQAYIQVNRDIAARLGVTMAAVDTALYNAFGQRLVSTIFTESNQYRVVLEVKPQFAQGPQAINSVYVATADGGQVPLGTLARVDIRPVALSISHLGQFPAATISFNLAEGASLGKAVSAIEDSLKEIGAPPGVQITFQGAAAAFQSSLTNTLLLILAAVVTMYIVLGILYESYIHPVTILSTLPSAGVGALLALLLTGNDLDVIGIIGIILLIGIVKKNAIMMVDFALEAEREQNLPPREAIYQACLLRFRPILMTTMAALLGALPLMLGTGVGSELRQPLGITMVGGLLVSQLLTLFTTPVIYLEFERLSKRMAEWRHKRLGINADPETAAGTENPNLPRVPPPGVKGRGRRS